MDNEVNLVCSLKFTLIVCKFLSPEDPSSGGIPRDGLPLVGGISGSSITAGTFGSIIALSIGMGPI